ncbi:MAG TPA: orotate phosphoribosyltransferase [Alphaproteobacteria bacterium]|nr:orotate phosphoribosyltransferase [Alphaproteobacteria bacterium]HBA44084.1 orotate phosphoribosyltransferase [Alphaproteobacteria bacterium]HBC52975.1 orotate phosphoribosyltransferase [Alphaproteobacteria bacterium]HCO91097.1 orotate phosphoribosyltransferase [Alphaproteobacteria bacterium]
MALRETLQAIIAEKSFAMGKEMTLASGKKSNFYFNMKPTMLDPAGADAIARLVLARAGGLAVDYVGGLEMGAVPIACSVAVVSHNTGAALPALIIRKQAKGHGTQQRIEGVPPGEALRGKTILIVEDVTTTGGSLLDAVKVLRAEGAEVTHAITIVDRLEGAAQMLAEQGITLEPLLTADDFLDTRG